VNVKKPNFTTKAPGNRWSEVRPWVVKQTFYIWNEAHLGSFGAHRGCLKVKLFAMAWIFYFPRQRGKAARFIAFFLENAFAPLVKIKTSKAHQHR
jgi:hypothetical protein